MKRWGVLKKSINLLKTIRIMPSKRSKQKQNLHDAAVREIARELRFKFPNSEIYADIPGFQSPGRIGRHIPDIWVKHPNGRETVIEIETEDTVNTQHAKSQAQSFRGYANLNGPRVSFKRFLAEDIL